MASDPYYSKHRNQWCLKYKPEPKGRWVEVGLGKHNRPVKPGAVPAKAPPDVVVRAREFADIEYRAQHGMSTGPKRPKPLQAFLDDYTASYEATHDLGSVKQLRRHAKRFGDYCRHHRALTVQSVSRDLCSEYLAERIRHVKPATLQAEKGYLAPIWSKAVLSGFMDVNPWSGLKVPGKIPDPDPTFWKGEDIARIVAAARKDWARDLILILANTGIRISAVLAMRWDWIDWGGFDGAGSIRVPKENDKGGYGYTQTMEQGARIVLERRHVESKSPFVFPHWKHGDQSIAYDTAADAITKAIVRAKVKPGTAHDFRHSYGRALERDRTPMSIIQRQLGHRSASHTLRYTTASDDETAKWVGGLKLGFLPPAVPPEPPSPDT